MFSIDYKRCEREPRFPTRTTSFINDIHIENDVENEDVIKDISIKSSKSNTIAKIVKC